MIEIFGIVTVVRAKVVSGVGAEVRGLFGVILSEILAGLTALFVTESFRICTLRLLFSDCNKAN